MLHVSVILDNLQASKYIIIKPKWTCFKSILQFVRSNFWGWSRIIKTCSTSCYIEWICCAWLQYINYY